MEISTEALQKLPTSYRILGETRTRDMDGNLRDVVIVLYTCGHSRQLRKSYFDSKNGEYLGEAA